MSGLPRDGGLAGKCGRPQGRGLVGRPRWGTTAASATARRKQFNDRIPLGAGLIGHPPAAPLIALPQASGAGPFGAGVLGFTPAPKQSTAMR